MVKESVRALTDDDLERSWTIECNFCGSISSINGYFDKNKAAEHFENEGWMITTFPGVGEIGIWCGHCNPDEE